MNADSIKIEWDEDGCYAVVQLDAEIPLVTDESVLRFRITDPEALYDHVKAAIGPWLQEKYAAKAEYDRAKRQNDTRTMDDQQFTEYLDDAYGDNWSKRAGMEQMREGGYA